MLVQRALAALEHAVGSPDGVFGTRTREGIRAYQEGKGLPETGHLTREQAEALVALGEDAQRRAEAERKEQERLVEERRKAEEEERARQRSEAARRADEEAFARAQGLGTVAAYEEYLRTRPNGVHEAEARRLRDEASQVKRVGEVFRDCAQCPELIVVPAGTFRMGSPSHEEGRNDDEGPVHEVRISESIAVGVYEVTRGQWSAFVSATGHYTGNSCWTYESGEGEERSGRSWSNPGFSQGDGHPVVCVSWEDAQRYVTWLTRRTGEAYRLLGESEWEYVARAGTTTPFHFGATISTDQANYDGDYTYGSGREGKYREKTVPVESFAANRFGLHNVHGNVWEWTADCWNESYEGAPRDGRAWERGDCSKRVLRGGSWYSFPGSLRSATRYWNSTGYRYDLNGFRIARTLTPLNPYLFTSCRGSRGRSPLVDSLRIAWSASVLALRGARQQLRADTHSPHSSCGKCTACTRARTKHDRRVTMPEQLNPMAMSSAPGRAGLAATRVQDATPGRRRRLAALVPTLALGVLAGSAVAEEQGEACDADCLARGLIARIPAGERIALIPFGFPETGIPREDADDLYGRIARALFESSGGQHVFVAKNRTEAVWKSWQEEREESDFEAFWEQRRVSVTVHCEDRGLRGSGIALSCLAAPVGEASRLEGDVFAPLAVLPVARSWFEHEHALGGLGLGLARAAPSPERIDSVFIVDSSGQRSRLTEHLGRKLRGAIEEALEVRRRVLRGQANMEAAMGQGGDEAAAPRRGFALHGEIGWVDEQSATLSVSLWEGEDVVAEADGRLERAWLPPRLVADAGVRRYRASARALESADLPEDSARRAVKNLARARVVAQALGIAAPEIAEVRSERDGLQALHGTLHHGIPVDERFEGPWRGAGGDWRVELDARVAKVGATLRPEFEARLEDDDLRARDEVRIELSARDAVHAAVFIWAADNNVYRLYPNQTRPELRVPARGRVMLPQSGEDRLLAMPMPGSREDHGAIVVVASIEALEFAALAPPAVDVESMTELVTVPGGVFFEALAALDLSHAALAVLPYRVTR